MTQQAETIPEQQVRDVVIIGSGPAGYTAAVYAARANLHPLVLAGSVTAGGALMNTTEVENFPGFPEGVLGPDLMAKMQEQAERFGAEVVYDDAESVDLTAEPKVIRTADGETHLARTVILATGSAYKELGVPGEKRLAGHGVSWCATCDGFFFRDQHILVVGGGDSAVEEATFLTRFASRVTLVHRRDQLRASAIMAERAMANPKIAFAWNSTVEEIYGDTTVTGARLRDTETGAVRDVEASGVFVAIGHVPRTELVDGQVTLDAEGYIQVAHPSTATTIPGVFACGDAVDHVYRQAITAAGTGCAAALDAERYLAAREDVAAAPATTAAGGVPAPALVP
jgi:thioredoxin reductase (NADPH)